MKNKFYVKLTYGDTKEPNCSNFGDRILHWHSIYRYLYNSGMLEYYDICLPKSDWKEHEFIELENTFFVDNFEFDCEEIQKDIIQTNLILDKTKHYSIESPLISGNIDKKDLITNTLKLKKNYISDKFNKIDEKKILVSLHIRKGVGVIGSNYSTQNDDGYPDFTWNYYNNLIRRIRGILDINEKHFLIYISSDLPIDIIKKNITHPFISRLDFLSESNEIKIYETPSDIVFLDANMCDWMSFYYSDICVINPFSSFSSSASSFNTNLNKKVISLLDHTHTYQYKIQKYLNQNLEKAV